MADMTKCQYSDCPKAKVCYRIKAKDNMVQSYANFKEVCNEDNHYKMLIKISKNGIR
jgi:hypothetical protein